MKIVKSLILILMLAVAGLSYANVSTLDDDVRKELEAVYAKIDVAIKGKDIKTLESLLADDYEKRIGDKTLNRSEAIAQMKKNFEIVKEVSSAKATINKIQQVEGNEIVDYTQTVEGTVTTPDGKDQSFSLTNKGRDWWVKNDDGKWICVAAERVE